MNRSFYADSLDFMQTAINGGVRVSLIAGQSDMGVAPSPETPGQSLMGETPTRFTLSLVFEDGGIGFDD